MSRLGLAQWLHGSGAVHALLRARRYQTRSPWVTVLTYHRIHESPSAQCFDPGVIDATPQQFEEQLLTLRDYFTPVGVEDVLGFMKGRSLPPNPVVVTFDDGYRECFDTALPILQKLGIKATFFVSTNYITERRVFWWDRLSYIVNRTRLPALRLSYPRPLVLDFDKLGLDGVRRMLLAIAKSEYDLDIERFLTELERAAEVRWDRDIEHSFADQLVMTWDQVRELRRSGMEVSSHTRTHRILQNLRPDDLWQELFGSRRDIEEQLNEPIEALSYPVGRPIVRYDHVRAAVEEAGYRIGFSNASGCTRFVNGSIDPLDICRISLEVNLPIAYFRTLVAIPGFGG